MLYQPCLAILFEFTTKNTKARRQLVWVGLEQDDADQSSVDQAVTVDQFTDRMISQIQVKPYMEEIDKVSMQLEIAINEIISLK